MLDILHIYGPWRLSFGRSYNVHCALDQLVGWGRSASARAGTDTGSYELLAQASPLVTFCLIPAHPGVYKPTEVFQPRFWRHGGGGGGTGI
jgi:hypothetical protein